MRFDKSFIRQISRDFMMSSIAEAWPFVSDDIRKALIDQRVMQCVLQASVIDGCEPFPPGELLELRAAITSQLQDGISLGSSGRRRLVLDCNFDAVFCRRHECREGSK